MIFPLAFFALAAAEQRPEASLRIAAEQAVLTASISVDEQGSRTIAIDCASGCPAPLRYRETVADMPLGLFRLSDADDLIYSYWGGGTGYRVRIWSVASDRVVKVMDAWTAGTPILGRTTGKSIEIWTFERRDRAPGYARTHSVKWVYRGGLFVRTAAGRRAAR